MISSTIRQPANSPTALTVILTGGTFDKDYPLRSDARGFEFHGRVRRMLEQYAVGADMEYIHLPPVDSLDMDEKYRAILFNACADARERVLITHGTSTIIETAQYLGKRADELARTVVLTGALRPAVMKETDADFNLGFALACAQHLPKGVYVAMNGQALAWDRVRRDNRVGMYFVDLDANDQEL